MTTPPKNRLEAAGFLDSCSSRKLHPNSILGSWERLSFDTLEEDAVSDSSQLQQHCRQVKVCLAATVLSPPTHPTRIDQCQALAEDNTKTHPPSLKDIQRHAGYSVGLDLSEIFPITTAVSTLRCSPVNYAYSGRSLGDIGSCSMLFTVCSAEDVSVLPQCCE